MPLVFTPTELHQQSGDPERKIAKKDKAGFDNLRMNGVPSQFI